MTRNERRKTAQLRLKLKSERIAKAHVARHTDLVAAVVRHNKASPIVRNYFPQSSIASLGDKSPRFKDSSNLSRSTVKGLDDNGRFHN